MQTITGFQPRVRSAGRFSAEASFTRRQLLSGLVGMAAIPLLSAWPSRDDSTAKEAPPVVLNQKAPRVPEAKTTMQVIHQSVPGTHAMLRGVILDPEDPASELTVLSGRQVTGSILSTLMAQHHFSHLVNGTFFEGDFNLGDILGVSMNDPAKTMNSPFMAGKPAAKSSRNYLVRREHLKTQIYHRFYFALDHQNNPVIARRSQLRDKQGQLVPQGQRLDVLFKTCIGGLAVADFTDSRVVSALEHGDEGKFTALFNVTNPAFNHSNAYDGLDGGSPIARTAIGLIQGKAGQKPRIVMMALGNGMGRSRNSGLTLTQFARQFLLLARKYDARPLQLAVLDSGSSTFWAEAGHLYPPGGHPGSLLGIRKRPLMFC